MYSYETFTLNHTNYMVLHLRNEALNDIEYDFVLATSCLLFRVQVASNWHYFTFIHNLLTAHKPILIAHIGALNMCISFLPKWLLHIHAILVYSTMSFKCTVPWVKSLKLLRWMSERCLSLLWLYFVWNHFDRLVQKSYHYIASSMVVWPVCTDPLIVLHQGIIPLQPSP